MKKSTAKKPAKRVIRAEKIKEVVDNTQRVMGEVDTINRVISSTLYIRDNVAVDLKNFSLISISDPKTLK